MSESTSESRWSMGLGGTWAQIANATAIGIICVLFVLSWYESRNDRRHYQRVNEQLLEQAEENRQAIRAMAKQLREQKR